MNRTDEVASQVPWATEVPLAGVLPGGADREASGEAAWTRFYDPGVPARVDVPDVTLDSFVRDAARRFPDRIALDFFRARTSFGQLDRAVDRFARALTSLGLAPGDRVSLHLPTSPAFVIAAQGTLRAGGIVVPVNPLYVEREVAGILADTTPRFSVALDLVLPRVRAGRSAAGLPADGAIMAVGLQDMLPRPLRWLYPLRARREGRWAPVPHSETTPAFFRTLAGSPDGPFQSRADPDDPAVLQATGGTTGIPKAAILTHRNLVANAVQVAAWFKGPPDRPDRVLGVLPYFHIYGLTVAMDYALLLGYTQVMLPRFDVLPVLKAIARTKPHFFPGAPIMYAALSDHPDRAKYDLRSIDACISGSAPLPAAVQERFELATGGRLVEGYGLSEASPVTHCNPVLGHRRPGTIGLPFPSTEAQVVDLETGTRPLPPGEPGELRVRGPQVMAGYWNRPDETALVLRDGWLYTGDIATIDQDGYATIVDRRKDLIIVGGMNVYPREIEEILQRHPAVAEAAVIGVRVEDRGEVPQAFVVLRPGMQATPDEIVEHCFQNLARFKVPRLVEIREELPRTFVGKVLRRVLAEEQRARGAGGQPDRSETGADGTVGEEAGDAEAVTAGGEPGVAAPTTGDRASVDLTDAAGRAPGASA